MQIDQGHWSDTRLDGLRFVGIRGQFTKVEARQRLSSMPERGKRSAEPCCELSQGRTPNLAQPFFKSSPPLSRRCTIPPSPPFASVDFDVDVDARRGRASPRDAANRSGIR